MIAESKKRILFLITSSDFGGAETLFYQQVQSLNKDRFQTLICSIKPKGRIAHKLETEGFNVCSLNAEMRNWIFTPWKMWGKCWELLGIIRAFKPDVLHTSLFQADVLGAIVGTYARVPVRVATVHMVMKEKWMELLIERCLSPFLTCYLAVSDNIRSFYSHRLGVNEKKIKTLYNAVDESALQRRASEPPKPVIDFLPPWFISVGRIDPQKDLDNLISSIQILIQNHSDTRFLLIGDGPDRQRLESKVTELNLVKNIRFLGFQDNPLPFVAQCHALVLSSREEGLPMVILEAMALGKPVISTDVGGVSEVVQEGKTGYLVPPGNPAALAEALEKVLRQKDEAQVLGQNAKRFIKERFSLEHMSQLLESIYSAFLTSRTR